MRLIDTKSGDIVKIVGFEGECDEFKCRLSAMGFTIGDMVKVINRGFFGPLQIEANGSKIALCRGQAKKIIVKKIDS